MPAKTRIVRFACLGCHWVCQVRLHLEGERVVKVTGELGSPTFRAETQPRNISIKL